MTVQELIAKLKKLDPGSEVRIAQPTHDHWRNIVAVEIDHVSTVDLVWSAYHDEYKLSCNDDDDAKTLEAVVIR